VRVPVRGGCRWYKLRHNPTLLAAIDAAAAESAAAEPAAADFEAAGQAAAEDAGGKSLALLPLSQARARLIAHARV
jgi:hypothetical protein